MRSLWASVVRSVHAERIVVLAVLFLCPARAEARLGPPVPFPELDGILKPSPQYLCAILPALCVALIVLFILYRRSHLAEAIPIRRLVWIGVVTASSGLWLFAALPSGYKRFHDVFIGFGVEPMELPVCWWPPIIVTARILWGTLLLLLWFLLQPIILHSLRRSSATIAQEKPASWPLLLFTAAFTIWFVVAVFRPLCTLK
jgi:hypothetical protein